MFLRAFSAWDMLNTSSFYLPRILGSCKCNSINSTFSGEKIATDVSTNLKSNEKNGSEKGKNKKPSDKKKLFANAVEPALESERREEINSVVGIHLGPKSLYWAKINRKGDLLEWKSMDLFPSVEIGRKMQLPKIFAMMDYTSEKIPFSDIFVLESPNHSMLTSMSSPAVISTAILRSQLTAILLTILNLRAENDNSEEYYHKVFMMKPRIVSRFFNLLIGSERVSALSLVDSILGIRNHSHPVSISAIMGERNMDDESAPNTGDSTKPSIPIYSAIQAPSSIVELYRALEAVEREAMSQALLLTMAFYDLVVFKNLKALATLQQ